MNISSETLKALYRVTQDNPKHSPAFHWCDYYRWLDFICCSYKNNDYIESWDLYNYFIDNGYKNFEEQVEELVKDYQTSLDLINHLLHTDAVGGNDNIKWLIEELKNVHKN